MLSILLTSAPHAIRSFVVVAHGNLEKTKHIYGNICVAITSTSVIECILIITVEINISTIITNNYYINKIIITNLQIWFV